jgi:hypothetical protein
MFIIAGSGRSGTSAVARVLHVSGISVGHDLIEADDSNAEGYFEERAVVALNDRILAAVGLHEWFSSATREELMAAAEPLRDDMRALLETATPAWKDPRFSWTLEPWLSVMPEKPRVIVCLRSPAEVVESTMKYYGLAGDEPERAVLHLWRAQYERLLDVVADRALDAFSVEFHALQGGERKVFESLERFVGQPLDADAVRPELRHHEAEVTGDLSELYERVRSLGRASTRPARRDGGRGASAP